MKVYPLYVVKASLRASETKLIVVVKHVEPRLWFKLRH